MGIVGGQKDVHSNCHSLILTYKQQNKRRLCDPVAQKVNDCIYVTLFRGLTLREYIAARTLYCEMHHKQPCTSCNAMLHVAQAVSSNGFQKLSEAFRAAFLNLTYKQDTARLRLLQMPLVCICLGDSRKQTQFWYLVEFIEGVDYMKFVHFAAALQSAKPVANPAISSSEVKSILSLAQSDRERELIRYSVFKASGLSVTAARKVFGFLGMDVRSHQVEEAIDEARRICEAVDSLARTREKAILLSMGVELESELESDDAEGEELNIDPVYDPLNNVLDYEILSSEFGLRMDRVGTAESPPLNPHPQTGIAGSRSFTAPAPPSHEGEKLSPEMDRVSAAESSPQNPHPQTGIAGSRSFTAPTPLSHEGEKLSPEMDRVSAAESSPQNPHPQTGIAGSRSFTAPAPPSHEGEKLSPEMDRVGAAESSPQNPHSQSDIAGSRSFTAPAPPSHEGEKLSSGMDCVSNSACASIFQDWELQRSLHLPQFCEMQEILKAGQYNWFCVVEYIEEESGLEYSAPPLKEHLNNFYSYILYLCRPSETILLKQSFDAFDAASKADLEDERTAAAVNDSIVTDSEDEDLGEVVTLSSLASKRAKEVIAQKRKALVRQFRRQKAKALADRRFLSRTVSRKVKNIVDKFPDIGKTVEEFVEASNVGADAWRRTGVLTFDVNQRLKTKVTYSRIQQHLNSLPTVALAYYVMQ